MWKYSINSVSIGIAIAFNSGYQSIAQAQINPDDSLGSESSTVVPDNINGIPSDRLEGGATRGANLFHSFQDFNVELNRGAYFATTGQSGDVNIAGRSLLLTDNSNYSTSYNKIQRSGQQHRTTCTSGLSH